VDKGRKKPGKYLLFQLQFLPEVLDPAAEAGKEVTG